MRTIKQRVLSDIAKRKQCSRQDVQKFIWVAQGNDIKDYVKRNGYYGTNIVSWKYKGLVNNDTKNVFKITKKGKEYLKNPNLYNKMARNERKVALYNGMQKRYNELWKENQELKRKVWKLQDAVSSYTHHIQVLEMNSKRDTLQDALDYFEMMEGNYSGDTAYYLQVLIKNLKK